jgi:hypothetical protein
MLLKMVSISATISRFVFAAAVAGRLAAAYYAVDDRSSTADALVCLKRSEGTIADAGSAFHAPVLVQNDRLFVFQGKNSMRAYLNAHSTADTTSGEKFKACRI